MRFSGTAVSFIFSCFILPGFSQSDTVTIKGTVTDYYTKKGFPGISIINPKSAFTLSTDGKGFFEERIHKKDTLFLFYPAYQTIKFSVSDSVLKSEYVLHFVMQPLSTGLNQPVVIKAPKTLEQIEEDRKKLGITPKELEKPEIDAFQSPISALYELLSARAHEREKLKKQMTENNRRKVLRELLNYYNENGLIDLPEEHYDDFINFSNLSLEFLKYNTDYEITKTVIALYNKYMRASGLLK